DADPNAINLSYNGVKRLAVNKAGDLVLHTASGEIVQHKPVIYQELADGRREVAGRYEITQNRVGFRVDEYDRSVALVIDPIVLAYSTYLGGTNNDTGNGIAVDGAGSAYVTKLNASGSALVYSTYLGGDDYEIASSIAVDTADNAYVTGDTFSGNFP